MDTRPWRLAFPSPSPSPSPSPGTGSSESESDGDGDRHRPTTISWFDVDARCVLRAKARELEEAGAEVPEGAFDLAFEPLEVEDFDLVLPAQFSGDPRLQRLLEVLGSRAFHRELGVVGGYDLATAGSVVKLASD